MSTREEDAAFNRARHDMISDRDEVLSVHRRTPAAYIELATIAARDELEALRKWQRDVASGTGYWEPETGECAPAATIVQAFEGRSWKARDYDEAQDARVECES